MLATIALIGSMAPIQLRVDASECGNGIIHVEESIPVRAGGCDLVLPKWAPWIHGPSGRINSIIDLHFSEGGRELEWRRDGTNMFLFHVGVPRTSNTLSAKFDYVFAYGTEATEGLAFVDFFNLVLYPSRASASKVEISPSVKLPSGWKCGTNLERQGESFGAIDFRTCSLLDLVESPIVTGVDFEETRIPAPGGQPHLLDVASDKGGAASVPAETVASLTRLVSEADELFGARHYNRYRWLVTVSDTFPGRGWEHQECSEDGTGPGGLDAGFSEFGPLLAHEYVHSWNGKYRRPAGEATTNYQEPLVGDLLWVYEGLTQYLGTILSVRAGIRPAVGALQYLASIAANLDGMPGKTWRSIEDTGVSTQLFGPGDSFRDFRRGQDYYSEGVLLWLDVDTKIRMLTDGKKSLDDFCRVFFGGVASGPEVRPYREADVVAALRQVVEFPWAEFFKLRVYDVHPAVDQDGIANGGWQLLYDDAGSADPTYLNLRNGLGALILQSGLIWRPFPGSPAERAGLRDGMVIQQVNGAAFSIEGMRQAVLAAEAGRAIDLTVKLHGMVRQISIEYRGGLRQPHLQRDTTRPDILDLILKPLQGKHA